MYLHILVSMEDSRTNPSQIRRDYLSFEGVKSYMWILGCDQSRVPTETCVYSSQVTLRSLYMWEKVILTARVGVSNPCVVQVSVVYVKNSSS